jgi:hypothetical protein
MSKLPFFPGVTDFQRTLSPKLSNKAEAAASVALSGQNMEINRTM